MFEKLLFLYFFAIKHMKRALCVFVIISFIFAFDVQLQKANACFPCELAVSLVADSLWKESERDFDARSNSEFFRLEAFVFNNIWMDSILPVLMLSAEQFTSVAMQQVFIIGTFLDAKSQLETQLLLQLMQAQAHRDYHPSEGMCEFGTAMKALASSEMRSEFTSFVLSQRSQDRQMGSTQSVGAYGNDLDKVFRINQFKDKFCNEQDRRASLGGRPGGGPTGLSTLCSGMAYNEPMPTEKMIQMNKDIDFFSTVDSPLTLSINFTNDVITDSAATPPVMNEDEENVFALSANLFGSEGFARPPPKTLEFIPGQQLTTMQQAFMDMRSLIAKRSVVENSFNAIVGSKSEGVRATDFDGEPVNSSSGAQLPMRSRSFIQNIIKNLGVSAADSLKYLGENPSYNAQMEILTKKIFQSPDFYTNLYDKPMNVQRKIVTMQAIKMMQKFDMLKSSLRDESALSILLELAVTDLQQEIELQINTIDVSVTR